MAPDLEIRPVTEPDIAFVEELFREGGTAKHTNRLARQQSGEVCYLFAWRQGLPVGHLLLRWAGSEDERIFRHLGSACPGVSDLFVRAELRSQGIGTALLSFAEQRARERGFGQIGLSVAAAGNERARQLYERLGYRDAGLGAYTECGAYIDAQGQHRTWEELCIYLAKDLEG